MCDTIPIMKIQNKADAMHFAINTTLHYTCGEGNKVDYEIVDSFELEGKRFAALADPETEENQDSESYVYIMEIVFYNYHSCFHMDVCYNYPFHMVIVYYS